MGSDGTIYTWSYGSRILHAINPDGSTRWTKPAGGQAVEAPSVAADGTLYVGYYDGAHTLHAFDPDGGEKWVYALDDWIYSSSSIAADGTIYVGTLDGKLHAVYPDGTPHGSPVGNLWWSEPPPADHLQMSELRAAIEIGDDTPPGDYVAAIKACDAASDRCMTAKTPFRVLAGPAP